ncbi:MAG: CoA-acylating methylmalonate-semialdehyde dehydrogenase [Candidatus Bipolaricaulota bacterium]|nr:CoA-acylating methylmalonate-semialdehyde dehydrogenase [Candidatus Bipolaricaulota bacterium]
MAILPEPIQGVKKVENYIGGKWIASRGDVRDVVNPATGKTIATVPLSTESEFDAAVEAAHAAFPEWRRTTPLARSRMLFRLKELTEQHFEEVSRIQTQEHGKTIDESRGETRRGIENIEVACGIPTLMQGSYSEDIASGIDEWLIPTPLGVFGIIGPFNFPWMIPLWSAPYAVATGNCVVVKPSGEVPLSQDRLAELVEEADFPPGVWNVVHGGRETVGNMLDHPDIVGVTFVGSTPTGRDVVYKKCAESGKRVIAQCGAKNFMTVMPDCNVERTIAAMLTSFFGNAGQRCLAASNCVIVGDDDQFYRDFVGRVLEAARSIRVGYGLDESVQMGPLRDREKKERVVRYIESGIKDGAKLRLDGRSVKVETPCKADCFLGPTVFENVTPEMAIGSEEIFGPVMSIMRAGSLKEAINVANQSRYGNGHSIFTSNGRSARQFQYEIESGNVGINVGIVAPVAFFPFSGMKDSFFGDLHTQGRDVIRFFTESKVVIQRWF